MARWSAMVSPLRRMAASFASGSSTSDGVPAWARRMKRAQTINQGYPLPHMPSAVVIAPVAELG